MKAETVVTFGMGEELFALPVAAVREILDPPRLSRLPGAPEHVLGLIDVRGASVAVVDLRLLLGQPPREDTQDTRIVVLNVERGGRRHVVALRTDRVIEVAELDEGRHEPLAEAELLHWDERVVAGIGRRGGAFVTVLDLDRMFDARVLASTHVALPEPAGEEAT